MQKLRLALPFAVKIAAKFAQRFDSDAVTTMKLVPKAYVPWSEDGCGLAEARDRTADRATWNRLQEINGKSAPSSLEKSEETAIRQRIDACCVDHLTSGRLIAYGRLGSHDAARHLISSESWAAFTTIDWQKSLAADGQPGTSAYFDVLVFPPLLAPNRVDLFEDKSLVEVLANFVLSDAEVAALAAEAIELSPDYANVFVEGRCHVYGCAEWPLAFEQSSMIAAVHPNPALRSLFDGQPDVLEVFTAAEALIHRYCAFISLLRKRELSALGISAKGGGPSRILHSIWSHKQFFLDLKSGDILQINHRATGSNDWHIRRWLALALERGVSAEPTPHLEIATTSLHRVSEPAVRGTQSLGRADAESSDTLFHVKPATSHGLRSDATDVLRAPSRPRKGTARVETSGVARKACLEWLVQIMKENPSERGPSVEALWAHAHAQWANLSQRAFLSARTEAIQKTGAAAWAAAGAPKKLAPRQSPR